MRRHVQNWISFRKAASASASGATCALGSSHRKSAARKYTGEKQKKALVKHCAVFLCVCWSFPPKHVDWLTLFYKTKLPKPWEQCSPKVVLILINVKNTFRRSKMRNKMNMFATNSGNSLCHWSERDSDTNKSSVCVSKVTVYFNIEVIFLLALIQAYWLMFV